MAPSSAATIDSDQLNGKATGDAAFAHGLQITVELARGLRSALDTQQ